MTAAPTNGVGASAQNSARLCSGNCHKISAVSTGPWRASVGPATVPVPPSAGGSTTRAVVLKRTVARRMSRTAATRSRLWFGEGHRSGAHGVFASCCGGSGPQQVVGKIVFPVQDEGHLEGVAALSSFFPKCLRMRSELVHVNAEEPPPTLVSARRMAGIRHHQSVCTAAKRSPTSRRDIGLDNAPNCSCRLGKPIGGQGQKSRRLIPVRSGSAR